MDAEVPVDVDLFADSSAWLAPTVPAKTAREPAKTVDRRVSMAAPEKRAVNAHQTIREDPE